MDYYGLAYDNGKITNAWDISDVHRSLAELNDSGDFDFDDIASFIEDGAVMLRSRLSHLE